jgi:hypothetical protein
LQAQLILIAIRPKAVFGPAFRNLVPVVLRCHTLPSMSQAPASVAPAVFSVRAKTGQQRPLRVKLRGAVLALIRLPNRRQVRAKIHQLSISGGLMHLEKPLDEKLQVELIFHIGEATVREKAEMLFPMWATQGWLQPFRFLDLPETSKDTLEASLQSFLQQLQQTQS